MTIAEAAEMLGLSEKTIRAQVAAGKLAVIRRKGHPISIPRAEVERYRSASLGKPGRRSAPAGDRP